MFEILITGGKVVDGTGAPWRYADVGITDGQIAAIGQLQSIGASQQIDARNKVVCPGFIDIHSHADITLLADQWTDLRLLQGITTEVVGQDGLAYAPLNAQGLDAWRRYLIALNGDFANVTWDWTSAHELLQRYVHRAANVVYLIPHGAVRTTVMGWDARAATESELRVMQELVRRELEQGAGGISTGLTYIPCAHATTEEMIALCEPVARAGGILSIHLRSYGAKLLDAIDEAIEIGRRSGVAVQLSHLRVADPSNWGLAYAMLERIDRARARGIDVTFDLYPYTVGCTALFVLLPPWAQSGGPDAMLARLNDSEMQQRMSDEMKSWNLDWSAYILSNAPHTALGDWEGFSVTSAAHALGMQPTEFVVQLVRATELNATMIAAGGSEADNEVLFRHPTCMVCSDGVMVGGQPHPRGYGAFPRVISQYVKNHPVLRLEEAIFKMTGLTASRLNLRERGILRDGFAADIVVFDPDTIADGATFKASRTPPRGVEWVLVNGRVAVANGAYRGSQAGAALKPLLYA